jgi:signal peptidase II
VKLRFAVLIILIVLIIDQTLKIWIKTTYPLGHVMDMAGQRWAQLYFIENKGMAWGWEIGGNWGKMLLTLFRLVAVIFGTWYITKIVRQHYTRGFIVCAALIYAGALGNLIDSLFYGIIFDRGMTYDTLTRSNVYYQGVAHFTSHGYAHFLHGNVVDMLYFPMIHATWPSWMPVIGGNEFEFFSPIFNVADASISVGVIALLLFQKRFFHKNEITVHHTVGTSSETSDQAHVI